MKINTRSLILGSSALLLLAAAFIPQTVQAGREMKPIIAQGSEWEPLRGELTLGLGGT